MPITKPRMRTFMTQLEDALRPLGFVPRGEGFSRAWPGGLDTIAPMTVDRGAGMALDLALNVRHDDVEAWVAEAQSEKVRPTAVTTITSTFDMRGPVEARGTGRLFHEMLWSDVLVGVRELGSFVSRDGETHFRALRDPIALERVFNEAPAERCLHSVNEVRRVLRGVALAALHRRHRLEEIIEAYRSAYVVRWDAKRLAPRFDAVVRAARAERPVTNS